jgi:hypothetical protein
MNAVLRWSAAIGLGLLPCRDAIGIPPIERLPLFDTRDTKGWSIAESTLEPAADKAPDGSPCLHWHVTVDHTAGEAKYPIGWPRFGRGIPEGTLRDWSAWDSLHFWLRADTSREELPREPVGLGLQTPDKASSFQRPLSELRKGQWVELDIPLREIPRHGDVRMIQFHISESKYQHGDRLDLLIAGPELRRPAQPILLDLSPECAVMYADAPRIPVRFRLAGVRPGERAEVELSFLRDGKCLIKAASRLERGENRIELESGHAALAPGNYEIEAGIAGLSEKVMGRVRLVESPWAK